MSTEAKTELLDHIVREELEYHNRIIGSKARVNE